MSFKVFLEFAILFAVFMNAMGTEFSTLIQDKLSHRAEPPVSFHQLINYRFDVLGIDFFGSSLYRVGE
jgi:hypothetical protein